MRFFTFHNSVGNFEWCKKWFSCSSCYFWKRSPFLTKFVIFLVKFKILLQNIQHAQFQDASNLFGFMLFAVNIFIQSKDCGFSSPSTKNTCESKRQILCTVFYEFRFLHTVSFLKQFHCLYTNQLHYLCLFSCNNLKIYPSLQGLSVVRNSIYIWNLSHSPYETGYQKSFNKQEEFNSGKNTAPYCDSATTGRSERAGLQMYVNANCWDAEGS
jgi:hypothetical protein